MAEPGLFASGTTGVANVTPGSYFLNVTSTCDTWSLTLTPE